MTNNRPRHLLRSRLASLPQQGSHNVRLFEPFVRDCISIMATSFCMCTVRPCISDQSWTFSPSTQRRHAFVATECVQDVYPWHFHNSMRLHTLMYRIVPKVSPLPSLTNRFLHRYFCLVYNPPPLLCENCTVSKN
jgi:hypothetical protein